MFSSADVKTVPALSIGHRKVIWLFDPVFVLCPLVQILVSELATAQKQQLLEPLCDVSQSNSKRLDRTIWILEVQCVGIVVNAAELHNLQTRLQNKYE